MFTIIASQDRQHQLAEAQEILASATLLESREFPNGATVSRFATERGTYACTVRRGGNLKLWLSGDYSAIVDKYDFLISCNFYTE